MMSNSTSEKYSFQYDDRNIELIKNELRSPESFVLKTEASPGESSAIAGKAIKVSAPVVALGFSVLTVSNFGFSFLAGGFFDKVQFSLISLFIAGVYVVPAAIALIVIAALISMIVDKNSNTVKKTSLFVNISEEVQKYIEFFDPERIYEYSSMCEIIEERKEQLRKFESLVKKSPKNFAFNKETDKKIERMCEEIAKLENETDSILESEMKRVVAAEDERKLQKEVEHKLEIQELIAQHEKRIEKEERLIESQILFELASDDSKDISDRDNK